MKQLNFANLMLIIVAASWGLTFPIIKAWGGHIDASAFVTVRFLMATFVLLPFIRTSEVWCKQTLVAGFVLGLLNCGVYILQTFSLAYISAARCAFLTGTVILWVPLFRRLIFESQVTAIHLLAGFLCLFGLWILTGANLNNIGIGDGMMLFAEAFFALSLLYLEKVGFMCPNPLVLTFYQILFTALLSLLISVARSSLSFLPFFKICPLMAVMFCGVIATALSLLLQVYYQRRTTSEYAALIYSTEPLWAAIFASMFFSERLTTSLIVGGTIIIFSVVLPELFMLAKQCSKIS